MSNKEVRENDRENEVGNNEQKEALYVEPEKMITYDEMIREKEVNMNKVIPNKQKEAFCVDPEKMITYDDMLNGKFPSDYDEYNDIYGENDFYDELDEFDEIHTGEQFVSGNTHDPTYYSKNPGEFNTWSNVLNKVVARNNELKEISQKEWDIPVFAENEVIENSEPLKLNKELPNKLDKDMYYVEGDYEEDDGENSDLDTISIMDDLFAYCKKLEASHRKLKKEVKNMRSMTHTIHYKLLKELSSVTFELEKIKNNFSPYFSSIDYYPETNNTKMTLDDFI